MREYGTMLIIETIVGACKVINRSFKTTSAMKPNM